METVIFRLTGLLLLSLGLISGARAADVPDHVPGRLLIMPRRDADANRITRTLQLHGLKLRKAVPELNFSVLDVAEASSDAVMQSLRDSGMFDNVERDHYASLAATTTVPNDPSYGSQWHLPKISAPQAWTINTGAASILVAVIDSGADGTHPDLASKLVPGWNFVTNAADTTDVLGHGTAVAGTFGAVTNNGIGVAGVNWNSKIMPLVVVDSNEFASYSNIATAIQYAVDHGARVINISIGGTSSSSVLQNAVDYAWSHNVLVFASAMNNSNTTPNFPAACNHAVAVSSTDSNDNLSSFSNYGSWIALAAPGSNILTTTMGGGSGYWAGTSFSSPIAAAVASLALSVNPGLTASSLLMLLEQNTDDLGAPGFDSYFGWGRVNAYKVVMAAQPSSVTSAPAAATLNAGQSQQFTATVTGATNTAVTWSLSPAVGTISSTGLYTAPSTIASSQTVTVTATAAAGGIATSTVTLAPVIVTSTPANVSLNAGQTQQFTATVTGTTNTAVTWSASAGTISSTGLYTAPSPVTALQTVIVTAKAATGAAATSTVALVPVQIAVSPNTVTIGPNQSQQFSATVTGTTNSAVTWSFSPAVGTLSTTGLYSAPSSVSSTQTITVTATGATGALGTATITLGGNISISRAFTPVRVNAGGPNYVDTLGQTWAADNSFTGGTPWSTTATISGSQAPAVYQTCRYGVFSYAFSAPNGSYTVNLKFSEPSLGGPGRRIFSVALNGTTVLTNFDVYAAAGGMNIAVDKSFPVSVTNGNIVIQFIQGSANLPMVSGIEIVQSATAFYPIRVNTGGPLYTDTQSLTWAADYGYTTGSTWSTSNAIAGTPSPGLYQTCRYGVFSYGFSVPNGNYTVNLKFAEISQGAPGLRSFNVGINGTAVLTNFDIYTAAGGMNIAVDRSFPVSVTNGQIGIQFTKGPANLPLISGIEIVSAAAPASLPAAIRVNSSGPAYTDSKGQAWAADAAFSGGNTWSTTGAIAGTTDPTLYQTCRWGVFSYGWTAPNGMYTVNLKFAEISRTAKGQRRFNAAINGTPVLNNFDIIAAAGAPMTATDQPFQVSVTNGQILIQFTPGAADMPLVNAIEIVPAATTGSTPKTNLITDPSRQIGFRR